MGYNIHVVYMHRRLLREPVRDGGFSSEVMWIRDKIGVKGTVEVEWRVYTESDESARWYFGYYDDNSEWVEHRYGTAKDGETYPYKIVKQSDGRWHIYIDGMHKIDYPDLLGYADIVQVGGEGNPQ